jgi:hypothetical protein
MSRSLRATRGACTSACARNAGLPRYSKTIEAPAILPAPASFLHWSCSMGSTTRRVFLLQLAAAGPVLAATPAAPPAAAGPAKVDEKDPQAAALGYAADTTKVDAKKYAAHKNDQKCSGCQLYGGKAGDAAGPCPIFAGKQVSANGWCSSYVKKAA